jgi:hypothetical protein
MHGFHNLEYRCGFIAANSADSSLSSSWRENSLLQVFAVANRGFVARGHRLAWLFAAGIPRADRYCRSVKRVGVVDLRQVVSNWARRPSSVALLNPSQLASFVVCGLPCLSQEIVIAPRRALHDELRLLTGLVVDRVVDGSNFELD